MRETEGIVPSYGFLEVPPPAPSRAHLGLGPTKRVLSGGEIAGRFRVAAAELARHVEARVGTNDRGRWLRARGRMPAAEAVPDDENDDQARGSDQPRDQPFSPTPRGEYRNAVEQAMLRLELDAVRAALRDRVRTPLGRRAASELAPFDEIDRAAERVEAIRQARTLIDAGETAPVFGGEEVEMIVDMAEKGVMLDGVQLRAAATTMVAGTELRHHLFRHEEDAPLLYGQAAGLPDLGRPARQITMCFDPDGQLSDDASPNLGALRSRVRKVRDAIHDQLKTLLTDAAIEPYLQESYFTVRAERHVLPVKASYKTHVKGIVHDASGSGQTVFIEPQAVIDAGNRLKIAQSELQEEEFRILSRLSRMVARNGDGLRATCGVLEVIDLWNAGARLASDLDAIPVTPHPEPGFALHEARHPLLVLQSITPDSVDADVDDGPPPVAYSKDNPRFEVVANDLALEPQQRVLVLTGPNTGGKTVALKTVGLFALMVRCGLHLPCEEPSRMGWFPRVAAIIGDQQSIEEKLSTFAAHVRDLLSTLQTARADSLVLVDEIAADTDPTQGQALAQAVLERIAELGAHCVVTTHFEALKALPFQDPRFRNAGVGFDEKRLRPTYRVTLDVPQNSSAFDIAAGLGLGRDVVDRARSLLGSASGGLEGLLRSVEERARSLEQAEIRADEARREAERARAESERTRQRLEKEVEEVRVRARRELLEEIEAAREKARRLVAELQKAQQEGASPDAMRKLTKAAEEIRELQDREQAKLDEVRPNKDRPARALGEVDVGQWVHVPKLGRDGEVVAVDGREAQVAVGSIRLRVPQKSLRPPSGPRPKRMTPKIAARRAASQRVAETDDAVVEELDVRGHSIEESVDRLDAFLDYHYGRPTTAVRVIHGHGTGALREALREHLRRSGYVRGLRPGEKEEGGDGVTVVQLI